MKNGPKHRKYVKPENIYILEMNDEFNEIISIPKDVNDEPITVDLCIVSLFLVDTLLTLNLTLCSLLLIIIIFSFLLF